MLSNVIAAGVFAPGPAPALTAGTSELLLTFAESYARDQGLAADSARQLLNTVRVWSRHLQRDATLADLRDDAVNAFLAARRNQPGLSRATVKRDRGNLLTLWNAAWGAERVPLPARRVALVRVPRYVRRAWTREEMQRLLAAAAALPGSTREGIAWSAYWTAFLRVGWDTGVRRGDLFRVASADIDAAGVFAITQHKTGDVHLARLHPSTLAALVAVGYPERPHPLRWTYGETTFRRRIRALVAAAGVRPGTAKWVRRASATAAELQQRGTAWQQLGHRGPNLAPLHYTDLTQLVPDAPRVPELGLPES